MSEKKAQLDDYLRIFREEEDVYVYTASILAGDKDSHKVLSTWSMMPSTWSHPRTPAPKDKRALWDWVWEGVSIDWFEFSVRAGITVSRLQRLFAPLRANRLVYPDGSLPSHASSFLKAEVLKALKKGQEKDDR